MIFASSKSIQRATIRNIGVPKTSDPIQIMIKMPNPSQEPAASSKVTNQDLKDIDDLCTFKIILDSQNSEHRFLKDLRPMILEHKHILSYFEKSKSESNSNLTAELP